MSLGEEGVLTCTCHDELNLRYTEPLGPVDIFYGCVRGLDMAIQPSLIAEVIRRHDDLLLDGLKAPF